jgi:predicted nucleic acid-binding protein
MAVFYLDTSVLLVYTLASGKEPERYPAVEQLFAHIADEHVTTMTSFYALHELYLFALEHAPDFEIGTAYGKDAMGQILATNIQVTPLLSRMERKINERLFRKLPDATDIPHAVSAKIWGCEGIVAYDDHFAAITDVIERLTPEQLLPRLQTSQE